MSGKEFGPESFSANEPSIEEQITSLKASIEQYKQDGPFFADYVELLEEQLDALEHGQTPAA